MASVRLIIPRRADGGHRDRLWKFCRRYWVAERPNWELVEGEHTEDCFNRSASINHAADGEWDVAVILDSDTILDCGPIDEAVVLASKTGHLVLPFTERCLLNRAGTRRILAGYRGSWEGFVSARQRPSDAYEYISGCQVVPRALWEKVGGFDERFESYGGEDDAFHAATMALSGHDARTDRLPGKAWHLWHPHSPDATDKPARRLVKALASRYVKCATDRDRMAELLAEPRTGEQAVVSVLTCPGRDTVGRAIASFDKHLRGPIGRRIICVDGEEADFDPFPGWETITMGEPSGFAQANARCQHHEIASGQPWVIHVEDDIELRDTLDVVEMQRVMEGHPDLAQLSVKRQPWHSEELEAGDMLKWRPEGTFLERDGHVAHRAFWTCTLSLTRRTFLAANPWPVKPGSERQFGRELFRRSGLCSGLLGKLDDAPRMTHIGKSRAGYGY